MSIWTLPTSNWQCKSLRGQLWFPTKLQFWIKDPDFWWKKKKFNYYIAHTESPVYLSFPGVVGLGHLRVSAGEESSLESVAALHNFAKMVRFSDFLYFLKIDQNRPIFAKLVLGHQRRYSGSVFSYDQGTIHSFQKSWCRIISIWNFRLQCKKNTVLRRTKIISTHLWEIVQMTLESLNFHETPLF